MNSELDELSAQLRVFAEERDWGQFHSPKNLAMALAAEAGEVLECFQWLTEEQSRNLNEEKREHVAEELADVLLYLLQLADKSGVDLMVAAKKKLLRNAARYPVESARGSAAKHQ